MALRKEEVLRKVLHFIFGSIIPLGIFYIPRFAEEHSWNAVPPWTLPPLILAFFLVFFVVMETLRFRVPVVQELFHDVFGSMLRHSEKEKATGATYILAASMFCSLIFKNYPHVSLMALSTFIWGDAAAALVGQSIGKTKIGDKSLEGSAACLALCLVFFLAVFPRLPGVLDAWNGRIPLALTIIASLGITLMELFPIKIGKIEINDNFSVPIITGAVMIVLFPFL
jgi:diacylglycerol kinase (CTP)